mmetsp:Transcript_33480/g.59582  ORF Transcript_33480/g.59582 Transcript_33480/m.59582 type:complete len:221 (+) Transcript_33480:79-741(+)
MALPRVGPQPLPLTFRRRLVDDVPEVPTELPEMLSDDDDDQLLEQVPTKDTAHTAAVAPFRAGYPAVAPCQAQCSAVPLRLEVAGSWGSASFPELSPRSGRMKRKDGDFLRINGEYVLRPALHNGAPCWEKPATADCEEARVIFRAADGRSWVIDENAHDGDVDDLVLSRMWTTAEDPTRARELWAPVPLCMHPAGVNCAGACLEVAKGKGKGTGMVNCC